MANIVGSIPKFALELVSSAGIGKAAVVVGKKGGQEATRALIRQVTREASGHAVKKATLAAMKRKAMLESTKRRAAAKVGRAWATKSVAGKVGRGAVKATALVAGMEFNSQLAARALGMESPGGIVSAAAASKALGRVEWNKDEFGRFQVAMDQAIPGTLELLPQGFVDAFIEVGSELSGGVLLKGAKGAFAKAGIKHGIKDIPLVNMLHGMQMKAAEKWLGKGGKHTMEALLEIAERGKFHGVMGEYLEERAGAMGRATVGLIPGWEDDFAGFDDVFPGVIDSAAELTAFSVIPIGAAGIGAANEIRIRHAEKNMSQSEILLSRAVREAKRAQGEAGT
ncbi:MAG: hypothetical protein GY930_00355, partial [bacterium]|nr:hypothetical protein [bacterium]